MSELEWAELNERVFLSGRQKQDFLIKSVLHQEIVVVGNKLVFNRLNTKLDQIAEHLSRIESAADLDWEILAPLRSAIDILTGFKEVAENSSDGAPQTPGSPFFDTRENVSEIPCADVITMSKSPKNMENTDKLRNAAMKKRW